MKNMKHPSFIIAIISIILFFIGIGMKANASRAGDIVIIVGIVLAAIHWIWSIIDVIKRSDMKPFQKRFWLIAVIAAPVIGAMFFYTMHQQKGKIVT